MFGPDDFGFAGGVPYHMAYAVRDIDDAMGSFGSLLELEWTDVLEGVEPRPGGAPIRYAFSRGGPVHLELFEGPGTIWATARRAELHHLAYWCADLVETVDDLERDGWELQLSTFDGELGLDAPPSEFAYLARAGWPRLELVDAKRIPAFVELTCHLGPASRPGYGQQAGCLR